MFCRRVFLVAGSEKNEYITTFYQRSYLIWRQRRTLLGIILISRNYFSRCQKLNHSYRIYPITDIHLDILSAVSRYASSSFFKTVSLEQILIVRHGETNENVLLILNTLTIRGRELFRADLVGPFKTCLIPDTKLNTDGIMQSRLVGKALASVPFTHVYCSPQTRALQVPLYGDIQVTF